VRRQGAVENGRIRIKCTKKIANNLSIFDDNVDDIQMN
jgi:hypothetical protein